MHNILTEATAIIKDLYGPNATFRDGQFEAIKATMSNRRTLVVQKTGWGKSLVYFACTKLNRMKGRGVTMVISPLLILMDNQIQAAQQLGLKCDVLNSTVKDRRADIIDSLRNDELDLILITPETLFSNDVYDIIPYVRIGLFVIDEVHCISDWGHDFRLEYGKLFKILNLIPSNVPILGTTATANNRVINDLQQQLGDEVFISRGPLTRDSLAIQVLNLSSKAERYAWILQHINNLPGSGIIYCLTRRDCEYLASFLQNNNVTARAYYSGRDEEENNEAITLFMENKIKAIVATIKLGMGYDKGDIGFVIHFQQPPNIVSYYQQIGRAGRNIDYANIVLMSGSEDQNIINYFIESAFPTEEIAEKVYNEFKRENGLSITNLTYRLNIKRRDISKALAFLEHEEFLYKEKSKYYLTVKPFRYNKQHYEEVTYNRLFEKEQMIKLISTKECLSKFIVNALDDVDAPRCNKCQNCLNSDVVPSEIDKKFILLAQDYINNSILEIEPRKRWPNKMHFPSTVIKYINEVGICLSKYGDAGYGEMVKTDKYSGDDRFRDLLVDRSYEVLSQIVKLHNIEYITNVPSLRSDIVLDFTKRLAQRLNINYLDTLIKRDARPQKFMENSSFQYKNAYESFDVKSLNQFPSKIILIDDLVDSRWTMTVCGYLLMESGIDKVFPFALADSSAQEG